MKKIPLLSFALLLVLFISIYTGCKKSSSSDSATTTTILSATINSTLWEPDTLSANINYNAAAKTKIFSFVGTVGQKRINGAIILSNATNANTFITGSYPINTNGSCTLLYSVQQKDSNGNYVFVPYVAAANGDGYINISAIDVVNSTITGTFSFSHKSINYDSSGNITSIANNVISGGTFTAMPYTFTTN